MRDLLLQDWVTLIHTSTTGPIVQGEPAWLDTSALQDVVAWLDVKAVTPTTISIIDALEVRLETSPVKETAFFTQMMTFPLYGSLVTNPGLSIQKALLRTIGGINAPVAAWTRWKVTEANTPYDWSITFRLWLAVNSACM